MPYLPAPTLANAAGLTVQLLHNGGIARIDHGPVTVNLFMGNELEGGPCQLYLRRREGERVLAVAPLLGPQAQATLQADERTARWQGEALGVSWRLELRLAAQQSAWFWQFEARLPADAIEAVSLDLVYAQDLALAGYGALRTNEYYVSHYLDHAPLEHAEHGPVLATRQNLAVDGRHPWALIGSLRRAVAFGTDALQLQRGQVLLGDLPGRRWQHEHAMALLQDEPLRLRPGEPVRAGFFALLKDDHPAASGPADLAALAPLLAAPEAALDALDDPGVAAALPELPSLFAIAPALASEAVDEATLQGWFPGDWRHVERGPDGTPWSFFLAEGAAHIVLPAKERAVLRPHGHLLRGGTGLRPDEQALTSTVWMDGVFHSMLTQGHVSINRLLSTQRSYLGLFRSQGLRVFIETEAGWSLLALPSAFEMRPQGCRWFYRHGETVLEVGSRSGDAPATMRLELALRAGPPRRLLLSLHLALNGDDGSAAGGAPKLQRHGEDFFIAPAPGSDLAERFPQGGFWLRPDGGAPWAAAGGDELLYADERSRGQSLLCLATGPVRALGLSIEGDLVPADSDAAGVPVSALDAALPRTRAPSPLQPLLDILPWFQHNALVHFLAPRGLEQYSGGGWGTRDVCQGPVELLLALGEPRPVRELLLRVFSYQNPDGDWPQWFMFFERERTIRADDSHGDIVFWPLLALAQYLLASHDAGLLDEALPFYAEDEAAAEHGTVAEHVARALALIESRRLPGTELVNYGHGDWNDALQPADPAMREHMCSAWTVTLHHQVLSTLAQALGALARAEEAARYGAAADRVLADFQRLLLPDGVLTGYARFDAGEAAEPIYLLHPRDRESGVGLSLLPMVHALINGLLSPAQVATHRQLIEAHLLGRDGARLFDRPMVYRGGPQRFFQRAESSAFFGREIGLMYMHAHLRYAEALAHLGEAEAFYEALSLAHPIDLAARVPGAAPRQANCYYSSSDAAFADRYQAQEQYERIEAGQVALEGGWRIYSSGAGIALSLVLRQLLGLRFEADALIIDPVLPPRFSGLVLQRQWQGVELELHYEIGPRGHGTQDLTLNGTALAFSRDANPYRLGAARVMRAAFEVLLLPGGALNRLTIRCA